MHEASGTGAVRLEKLICKGVLCSSPTAIHAESSSHLRLPRTIERDRRALLLKACWATHLLKLNVLVGYLHARLRHLLLVMMLETTWLLVHKLIGRLLLLCFIRLPLLKEIALTLWTPHF